MAVTQVNYTGNNSTTNYSFTFPYLDKTDVKVRIDGTTQPTTAYSFANATTISMDTAPATGAKIVIFRDTNNDSKKGSFYAGSAIKAEDLNDNFDQILYTAQEVDNNAFQASGATPMTGDIQLADGTGVIFEGTTDDAYETTLKAVDPTADRAINLPNVSGTVITTGDTGTVTSAMIATGAIVDADVNGSAAIQGTKISPNFGSQNIVTSGTIDGRDVSADGSKLDGIETAATADQTAAEIRTLVESASDSNVFTDADHSKLNAIEANATADQTNAEIRAAVEAATDSNVFTDSDHSKLNAIEDNATADQTNAEIRAAVEAATDSNVFTDADHTKLNAIETGATADQTASEIKVLIASSPLDASHLAANSVTTSEIADAELTTLAGMQSATASILAAGTDLTATIAEINSVVDGKAPQTTITDDDTKYPTSGAVVDYVTAQIAPLGGLEVIATEVAFPNTQPASGVVISISDAGGVVFNGSGSSTTGRTVGGSTVTINNAPSSLNSETLAAGVGLMVSSTGSSQTYNYHKILGKEDDIKQLSDDINDFNARYRIGTSDPSSDNDEGDLFFNKTANKMKVYDGSAWGEVTSTGDFKFLVAVDAGTTTAATFDGSDTSFDLKEDTVSGSAASVTNINQLMVVLNGIVQKPNGTSYSASNEGFHLTDADTIRFCTAPPTGSTCFIIQSGSAVTINSPANNTVASATLQNSSVTTDKIVDDAVTAAKLANSINTEIAANTAKTTNATHSGEVTGATALTIADNVVDEANLKVSNSPTNGYFLSAQSGNTGGLTWAAVDLSSKLSLTGGTLTGALSTNSDIRLAADGGSGRLEIGALSGGDLQLYHATNSYIINKTGDLYLYTSDGNDFYVAGQDGHTIIKGNDGGSVELYYDNAKKAETVTGGFTVTGTCTATAFAGDGSSLTGISAGPGTGQQYVKLESSGSLSNTGTNTYAGNAAGDALTSNSAHNTFFGDEAGKALTGDGYSTAVGAKALNAATSGHTNVAIGQVAQRDCIQGSYNVAVGNNTLLVNKSGSHNTAVGTYCLDALDDASYNTGVGKSCLGALTTGENNTAIGYNALFAQTTASNNTAVGREALGANTTGDYNTGIGTYAADSTTTGAANTALGGLALHTNTTGGNNTALGYKAQEVNTTGINNVSIGWKCLNANTTGSDNVAVGRDALGAQTTSNYNVAVGLSAGGACTGSWNTFIGNSAGAGKTGGSHCIYIGHNAGYQSGDEAEGNTIVGMHAGDALTSGDNNLFLGKYAGASSSPAGSVTTASNQLCLGNDDISSFYCADTSISSSDSRDKADITNFTPGLGFIKALRPVTYKWDKRSWYLTDPSGDITSVTRDGSKKKSKVNIGFVAQEVLEVEKANGFGGSTDTMLTVDLSDDGKRYGMKYERLVPVLVNAIKELEARIATLEAA